MSIRPDGRPPFRAEHVGSLLRPAALRHAFRRHAANEIGADEFAGILDQSIRDAVHMQEQIGLEVVTDGEFRRGSYWARFAERTDGLEVRAASFTFHDDQGHEMTFTAPYAVGKVRRTKPLALDEFEFLRKATNVTPKITLPAPSTMHFLRCADFADRSVYPDAERYFDDLAQVFQQEIAELAAAGCRYLQIDEIAIPLLCDPDIRDKVQRVGAEPDALIDLYIDAINQAVAAAPPDLIVGVHMCRGNLKGHYLGEGSYESVAERFFAGIRANHFLLEYDTPRAGDFKPLRFLPKTKGVVLGLVSSKAPALENRDALRRRLEDAARYVDIDRLAISPQCGFASTAAGNPLSEADERAKLQLVVDVARATWQ
jgi:5-methyltetrahydropteroyltriglutamate--homocysteine methyltransferase